MARHDARSLSASGLDPFLYSGVGVEANGSDLTVLSTLARLGFDPWTEAGRLVTLPRAVAASWFAERISRMPLAAIDLADAPETASRLIALLPATAHGTRVDPGSDVAGPREAKMTPEWAKLVVVWCALMFCAVALTHAPPARNAPEQTGSNHLGAAEPLDGARAALLAPIGHASKSAP